MDTQNTLNDLDTMIAKVDRLLRLSISDFLTVYRSNNYINITDIHPKCLDFEEKLPV